MSIGERFGEPVSFIRHKLYTETRHPRPCTVSNSLEQKLPDDIVSHIINKYDVDHCDPDDTGDCGLCTNGYTGSQTIQFDTDDDDYCIADCGNDRCRRQAKYGPFTVHGHAPKYCLQHYQYMKSQCLEKFKQTKDLPMFISEMKWIEDDRLPFLPFL